MMKSDQHMTKLKQKEQFAAAVESKRQGLRKEREKKQYGQKVKELETKEKQKKKQVAQEVASRLRQKRAKYAALCSLPTLIQQPGLHLVCCSHLCCPLGRQAMTR